MAALSVAPAMMHRMTAVGSNGMRLMASEAGAVNPGAGKAANEIPKMMARVIPFPAGSELPPMIGKPGSLNVFVTAADDIAGLNAQQLQTRLGIEPSVQYLVMRFPAPSMAIATPVKHPDPQFVGRGLTIGRAWEFVIPNTPIPSNTTIEIVKGTVPVVVEN
ncbi:MAG: polymorphic toxin type 10 domain-containing protein [Elusimicrobiota bacterium]|nr:MAG: polymorphic toxin type 10 domain-containing protein [Elusimicrobiota bacterium]